MLAESLTFSFDIEVPIDRATKAMEAMVISNAGRALETRDATLRHDLVLQVGFALLDETRAELFKKIDKQLAILSGAAPASPAAPARRSIQRSVSPPPIRPARPIYRAHPAATWLPPRKFSRLHVAAIAGAIVVTFALGLDRRRRPRLAKRRTQRQSRRRCVCRAHHQRRIRRQRRRQKQALECDRARPVSR